MILLGCRINTYLQTQSFRCIGLLDEIIHSKLIFKLHQLARWSTGTTFPALFERFAVAWAPQVVGGGQGDWVSARYTPPPYTYIHRPYRRALLTKTTTFTLPSYKCQPASQHHQRIDQHKLTSVVLWLYTFLKNWFKRKRFFLSFFVVFLLKTSDVSKP